MGLLLIERLLLVLSLIDWRSTHLLLVVVGKNFLCCYDFPPTVANSNFTRFVGSYYWVTVFGE